MKNIQPVIKWSGSKRKQAKKLLSEMPNEIETYYEPFLGGASVFASLALSDKKVERFILSDINDELISLWKLIQNDHLLVFEYYEYLWNEMKSIDDWDGKKEYYYSVRDRFNNNKSPLDFMFLLRTAFNGMARYNKSGKFNTPLHPDRDGIKPETLKKILVEWHDIICSRDVLFLCHSYEIIKTKENDFIYLDPPYAGIKGMYYGTLDDYSVLWKFLEAQRGKWILSFDGKTTNTEYENIVPKSLYKSHQFLKNGNSSFRRMTGKSNKEYVFESMYKNY